MRLAVRHAVLLLALAPIVASFAQVPIEQQVLDALNQARTNPAAYVGQLRRYRGWFKGKIVAIPGSREMVRTEEGTDAVDETIGEVSALKPMPAISLTPILHAAAADHVADQSRTGHTGHDGSDGTSPSERVQRRGGGPYDAEVIAYGSVDGADAVRQLIVDDGVADRGHRIIIFSPELQYAGVSCGRHPQFRTMCVVDLGMTPDGSLPKGLVGKSAAAPK